MGRGITWRDSRRSNISYVSFWSEVMLALACMPNASGSGFRGSESMYSMYLAKNSEDTQTPLLL